MQLYDCVRARNSGPALERSPRAARGYLSGMWSRIRHRQRLHRVRRPV